MEHRLISVGAEIHLMRMMQLIGLALVALSFLTAAYFYPQVPDRMASHWNLQGQADGYTNKDFGVFAIPVVSLALFVLLVLLPKLDPLKKNYAAFQKEYDTFVTMLVGFFYYLYLLSIAYNVGYAFDFSQALSPGFGGLFFYIGVVLEKARQNWFVGIRTPWTLSNEKVWDRTHELAGKVFKTAGVLAFLGVFVPGIGMLLAVVVAVAGALGTVVYSYLEFKKETE